MRSIGEDNKYTEYTINLVTFLSVPSISLWVDINETMRVISI